MNIYLPNKRLPTGYQEVEYIQSSGTQYINLGWNPTDNYFKVVCKATVYNSGNEWNVLFGTTNGSNSLSLQFRLANPYWNEGWYANIGSSGNIYSSISFVDGENVNINFTGNDGSYSLSLNNDTSIGSYNSTVAQSTRPFYLFAFNENGDATRKTNMKLYSFKLYSGVSTLVRDLVPCYRKSDNVIGLYDLVNSVFYTNQGTGTFSKGNDVTMTELKNAYIGEYKGIECDFTQSDYGFVFNSRTATDVTYGRDSNGLYCTRPRDLGACAWKIPSSIYSMGTIKKIQIELYSSSDYNGGGISYGADTYVSRIWSDSIESARGHGTSSAVVGYTPSGGYTFTLDFENKIASCSYTSTTLTLSDSDINTIRNYWSGGNLNIVSMVSPANTYSYIKKATFYV